MVRILPERKILMRFLLRFEPSPLLKKKSNTNCPAIYGTVKLFLGAGLSPRK